MTARNLLYFRFMGMSVNSKFRHPHITSFLFTISYSIFVILYIEYLLYNDDNQKKKRGIRMIFKETYDSASVMVMTVTLKAILPGSRYAEWEITNA